MKKVEIDIFLCNDVLVEIFRFVGFPDLLKSCYYVNKQFHSCSKNFLIWKEELNRVFTKTTEKKEFNYYGEFCNCFKNHLKWKEGAKVELIQTFGVPNYEPSGWFASEVIRCLRIYKEERGSERSNLLISLSDGYLQIIEKEGMDFTKVYGSDKFVSPLPYSCELINDKKFMIGGVKLFEFWDFKKNKSIWKRKEDCYCVVADGKNYIYTTNGCLKVMDLEKDNLVASHDWESHKYSTANEIVVNSQKDILVSGGDEGILRIFDNKANHCKFVRELQVGRSYGISCRNVIAGLSCDNNFLVSASFYCEGGGMMDELMLIEICDLRCTKTLKSFEVSNPNSNNKVGIQVDLLKFLYVADRLDYYDLEKANQRNLGASGMKNLKTFDVSCTRGCCDGNFLYTGNQNGEVRIYSL